MFPDDVRVPLRLSGAPNFRDAGGYAAAGGWRVKSGTLFRSEELSRLTDEDLGVLRGLGIQLVVDLRAASERERRPSRPFIAASVQVLYADSKSAAAGSLRGLGEILVRNPSVEGARHMMLESYRSLPDQCGGAVGSLIHELASGRAPALVHCTAGKDRTGFVCACVHHALQVPRDLLYEDYLLSGETPGREAMLAATAEVVEDRLGVSVSREVLEVIGSVGPELLDAAFDSIVGRFGSVEQYLGHWGVGADTLQRLRERLLERS